MNIGALLERGTNPLLLPYGLNHQQFSVLFEISRAGKVQQKDMINRLLLERAHVASHPDDGRSSWLSVSPQGRALIQTCQRLFGVQKRDWFRSFDTQELLRILDGVSALQGALSKRDEVHTPGGERTVDSIRRGTEVVHDQQSRGAQEWLKNHRQIQALRLLQHPSGAIDICHIDMHSLCA